MSNIKSWARKFWQICLPIDIVEVILNLTWLNNNITLILPKLYTYKPKFRDYWFWGQDSWIGRCTNVLFWELCAIGWFSLKINSFACNVYLRLKTCRQRNRDFFKLLHLQRKNRITSNDTESWCRGVIGLVSQEVIGR